ncbi:MAG TPA: ComF family protein [Chryseolinea sp.]
MTNISRYDIFGDFISLFFPKYCLSCDNALVKGENMICTMCMLEMPQTDYHKSRENPLSHRLSYRIPVKHAMALFKFSKNGRVQHLLHQLKYRNHPEIGVTLGRFYGEKMRDESELRSEVDVIIPIPLHPTRKRKRGYNQSAKFAEGLSERLEIPFTDELLERRIKTETQTRKTKLNRWENISGVFGLKVPESIRGKKVLLVDDVITTGSTLEACSQLLIGQGCQQLSIACIAEA